MALMNSPSDRAFRCPLHHKRESRHHVIGDDGKRFVVHADELLTAFLELESTIRAVSYWAGWGEAWSADRIIVCIPAR